MTEIKLHTFGERLIVSKKVTLASGNINSAELHVTVDEAWAAYSNFSATFETKEYIEPVEKLMVAKTATEYVCIIPSEVLQHQGILEIGIRGISNDGEMAKTSSIAKYNIVKGASPGNITLNPTMDMYQQYLAAMDSKTAPLFNAYKAKLDADFAAKVAELEEYKADLLESMTGTVLWENPSPSAAFGAQTIALDLTEYKKICVIFKSGTYSEWISSIKGQKYEAHDTNYIGTASRNSREYYFDDGGVVFEDAGYPGSTSSLVENDDIIPIKIIGYKY